MASGLGCVDGVDHVLRHVVALGMHHVLGGVALGHQAEGVDAHLELDRLPAHALVLDPLDELRGEVETSRGCRRGVLLVHGVDGLVLLGVALVLGDVGRKRHVSRLVDGGVERAAALRLEAHQASAPVVLEEVDDLAREYDLRRERRMQPACAVLDDDARLAEALAGVHEALPHVPQGVEVFSALEQERLGHTAGAALVTHESGRHDAGLVGNEKVARVQVVDDVGEVAVLERAVLAVENEEAAGVTGLRRCLCDELVWKRVVKVVGAHTCYLLVPLGWCSEVRRIVRRPPILARGAGGCSCGLALGLAAVAGLMALDGCLGGGEAASAVVLTIHAQVARGAGGLGVVGPEVAPHGREAVGGSRLGEHVSAGLEELVRRDGKRGRDVREAQLASRAAGLGKAEGIAGAAARGAVEAMRGDACLPRGAVVTGHHHVDVSDVRRPCAQRGKAAVMLRQGLDVWVGPTDGRFEALATQKLYGLYRAGTAAGMQEEGRAGVRGQDVVVHAFCHIDPLLVLTVQARRRWHPSRCTHKAKYYLPRPLLACY